MKTQACEISSEIVDTFDRICRPSAMTSLVTGMEGLEMLRIGWIICGKAGHVLETNRTAQEILRQVDGLAVGRDGVLCCSSPESNQILHRGLRRALNATVSEDAGTNVVLLVGKRRSGNRPLVLLVRSVRERLGTGFVQQTALVLIVDLANRSKATHGDLYTLYQFTPTEAELANLLMDGKRLKDCSDELDISYSTARTHLENMFRKTGVRHQSQLVSLLLRSIGLIRPEPG